jgi:hypothetical protein
MNSYCLSLSNDQLNIFRNWASVADDIYVTLDKDEGNQIQL